MAIVEIDNLEKRYGDLVAVTDFSLQADSGHILALVGPDGAGKTSVFRSLCGLMEFSGSARIAGFDVAENFERVKPLLGYMPQAFSLYQDLSVEENLRFYAGLFGIVKKDFDDRKQPLYEFSGLGPFAKRRAGLLSGGMKQKLALSCALIHEPQVLVLDEPTTGVDPLSRRQFWANLKTLRERGSAIIVSTPYMDEVAMVDRAIFIHNGHKLSEGTPDELVRQYDGQVYLASVEPTATRMNAIESIEGISARRFGAAMHLYTSTEVTLEHVRTMVQKADIAPENIEITEPDLEDIFIQLMGGES